MGTKKTISIVLISIVGVTLLAIVIYIFSGLLVPNSLKPGSFETALVHRGDVILTTQATGVVESENEVIILSPASSLIKSILKEPGNYVNEGETILQLNTQPVEDEIERLRDNLEVKRNNLEKTQLNAQSAKLDLDYNEEVKKLKITSLESQLADQKQLLEVGGISPAKLEQTKQEITLAEKDLNMLIEKNAIRLKQLDADEKGLLLQIRMDEKVLKNNQELLSEMDIKAPSSGIILNISGHVGDKVNTDKMLVQMSDLTSFKIIGSVDEQLANQVKTGNKVFVSLEEEQLEGLIGSVTPMVENNKVQFNVHLLQKSHPKLIANQNVQIQIVNGQKENVLRIKKLPEFGTAKKYDVFVIEGNKAVKRELTLGIIGNDYCEILSGVKEGDAVISEVNNAFRHLNEIEINN
jgi:HlyD family secretion protein